MASADDMSIPVKMDMFLKNGEAKKGVSFFMRPYDSDPYDMDLYLPRLMDMFSLDHPEKLRFCPWLMEVEYIMVYTSSTGYFTVTETQIQQIKEQVNGRQRNCANT